MKPVTPIIPGYRLPFVMIAKDQPEYIPIPAYFYNDKEGTILFRWKLTWRERIKVLLFGNIYHHILTFDQKLQPMQMSVDAPTFDDVVTDEAKAKVLPKLS